MAKKIVRKFGNKFSFCRGDFASEDAWEMMKDLGKEILIAEKIFGGYVPEFSDNVVFFVEPAPKMENENG